MALTIIVNIEVKPGMEGEFERATLVNARASIREPGIVRFDFVKSASEGGRYVLIEGYRDDAAPAAHKETAHYKAWKEAVEPMMAAPRTSTRHVALFMPEAGVGT